MGQYELNRAKQIEKNNLMLKKLGLLGNPFKEERRPARAAARKPAAAADAGRSPRPSRAAATRVASYFESPQRASYSHKPAALPALHLPPAPTASSSIDPVEDEDDASDARRYLEENDFQHCVTISPNSTAVRLSASHRRTRAHGSALGPHVDRRRAVASGDRSSSGPRECALREPPQPRSAKH